MKGMKAFEPDEATDDEVAQEAAAFGPLAQAVRELADAALRTRVDPADARAATDEIEALTARLRADQLPGSYGVRRRPDGRGRPWGNAVIGLRNPIAPPLAPVAEADRVVADFDLGAVYEGPPGLVHGGVVSLILDQMLGQAAGARGRPGMTGTLTIVYRQATPLGPLRAEAWIERAEGIKTWARGHVIGPDGVTAEADGVFILPRWARKLIEERGPDAPTPAYYE
ncbi:PaaI family thioesterase [Nocardioides sp. YIM 152588]|uniref:PaaI family thioesterase n=1 Tax=Nocardioides sp. YIM 152588 TaxID=3158259 RepID=UPI0032E3A87D